MFGAISNIKRYVGLGEVVVGQSNVIYFRGGQKFTLQGTNISHLKVAGKMIFLFHRLRRDMLVPRRV